MAETEKQRKLKEFEDKSKEKKTGVDASELAMKERHQNADIEKQRKMDQFKELSKVNSSTYNSGRAAIFLHLSLGGKYSPS